MLWALCNAELDVATLAAVASCRPTVASSTTVQAALRRPGRRPSGRRHMMGSAPRLGLPVDAGELPGRGTAIDPRALWLVARQLRGDLVFAPGRRAGIPVASVGFWRQLSC